MKDLKDIYLQKLREVDSSYHPQWKPVARVGLGEFGTIRKGVFVKAGELKNLGIDFETEEKKVNDIVSYGGDGSCEFGMEVSAQTGMAKGAVVIRLAKENSAFINIVFSRFREIADLPALKRKLAGLSKEEWNRDYVLVTEVYYTDNMVVVLSNEKDVEVGLGCDLENLSTLAVPKLGFSVRHSKGNFDRYMTGAGGESVTPLFRLRQLRKKELEVGCWDAGTPGNKSSLPMLKDQDPKAYTFGYV